MASLALAQVAGHPSAAPCNEEVGMGFFSGRIAFSRFRVAGPSPRQFGPDHLQRLEAHAIGKQRHAARDGVEIGWIGGAHILDRAFSLEKNIVVDTLHFALRIDTVKLPSDLLRAYTQEELAGLAAGNPSGRPSARQKRDARQAALQRLEDEARDGRFLKRKAYPVLWDAPSNELLIASTAAGAIDRLYTLFEATFGSRFEPVTAGRLAFRLAETRDQTRAVDDAQATAFAPGQKSTGIAWLADEASRDFLGNEYLLWLWFQVANDGEEIALADGSRAAVMPARSLVLECPRGVHGRETISSDAPTQLPEARRAIQAGRLPRKMGLTVARHDQAYELTLQAETLAVSGARLPVPEAIEERARLEERIGQLRHFLETLDLLYDAFCQRRASDDWTKEAARMKKWLQRSEQD